jgi:hypothetical protein
VYLRTAIGNAPWPIGLTMVGIHERTGREKISSSKVRVLCVWCVSVCVVCVGGGGGVCVCGWWGCVWVCVWVCGGGKRVDQLAIWMQHGPSDLMHAVRLVAHPAHQQQRTLNINNQQPTTNTQVAHIMNNEMQRKYLTSIKRLMRFAQVRTAVDVLCINM